MSRPPAPSARVEVVPYDPRWPQAAERAAAEVARALGPNVRAVHAIGSTSVPGLAAKPVIDLLAVIAELRDVDARAAEMERRGYEAKGSFGIEGRRYFRRDDAAGRRTHQVHVFAEGSPHVRRHLAFRDYLRAHPETAAAYGALKRRLAAAHPHDREAYMDGKDAFVKDTEQQALAWLAQQGDLLPAP